VFIAPLLTVGLVNIYEENLLHHNDSNKRDFDLIEEQFTSTTEGNK